MALVKGHVVKKKLPNEPLRAELLTPHRLREELATLKQKPMRDGYALMTSLPDAAVRCLESRLIPHNAGLSLYETRGGRACALLLVQAGPMLLRILVPLGTTDARSWLLEGLNRGFYLVVVDVPEVDQLTLVQAPVTAIPEAIAFARAVEASPTWVASSPEEFSDMLADLGRLTQSLLVRPASSIVRDFAVGDSWFALAAEIPMPIVAPPSDELH